MDKKTPLYSMHEKYNGKIVPFAGFLLPIQYQNGILYEHKLVREKAGLFDVSHMGEFLLKGNDALKNLNYLLTNDYTDLEDGMVRYGILCYENGTAVDDLLVYKLKENQYFIVVNASNTDKDFSYMKEHLFGDVEFTNLSDTIAQVALQGPASHNILMTLTDTIPEKYYSFIMDAKVQSVPCILSRTGYTGEDGFEIYCSNEDATTLWEILMNAGKPFGLEPTGLGCRDTLRLEAGMPLYGHELSDAITPLEAGLKPFIKLDKEFIGKDALQLPIKRRKIGIELIDKGIVREGSLVFVEDTQVGWVTSGTFSPTLNKAIAMALVDIEYIQDDMTYSVDIRGRKLRAKRTKLPFYKRNK